MVEGLLNCFKRVFAHLSSWIGAASTFAGVASDTTGHKLLVPSYVYWLIAIGALLFTAVRIQMELDEQTRKDRKPRPEIGLEALVTRLAGGADLMSTPGIPKKTGDALVDIREKANLGLLLVWGRPNAVASHLTYTPLELIPSEHWRLAQIDYMEYLQDRRCETKDARHPGTSPHYADLHFDKLQIDAVFPQQTTRKLRLRLPFAWE
jgi:hypothetical protein